MASLSIERTIQVSLPRDTCLQCAQAMVQSMSGKGYSLTNIIETSGVVNIDKLPNGVGYGERIVFTIRDGPGGHSELEVSVSAKGLPYLMWRGHCDKVMQEVLSAFDSVVALHANSNDSQQVTVPPAGQSIEERLDTLSTLLERSVISAAEYEKKRAEIIASI